MVFSRPPIQQNGIYGGPQKISQRDSIFYIKLGLDVEFLSNTIRNSLQLSYTLECLINRGGRLFFHGEIDNPPPIYCAPPHLLDKLKCMGLIPFSALFRLYSVVPTYSTYNHWCTLSMLNGGWRIAST